MALSAFTNRRVTVLGLGHFGGQIAVARFLCEQGAKVLVTDRASVESLAGSVKQLEGLPINYHFGEQRIEDFTDTDLIVTSPAVPPTSPWLAAGREAGVPITTEIGMFIERCRAGRIIGVTGTKGKSTTTALLGLMCSAAGPCKVGGNIGRSLLPELDAINSDTTVVLELSSYMLHWLGLAKWSPNVACVTMLGADHLDWHGGPDAYIAAKRNIVVNQSPGGILVRRDDAISQTFLPNPGVMLLTYPQASLPAFDLLLPGEHNQHNAQAAYLASGVDLATAQKAVRQFKGLPHRLELVHEAAGVRYYNDSIATIPEAAVIACDAFEPGTVIQIVGGYRKPGLSWNAMCTHLADRCKRVICIGELGADLAAACNHSKEVAEFAVTLDDAVARAKSLATVGDVVLLSPGTASYGEFVNFEQRGETFARLSRT